jgi:hypothetical protein
LLGSGLKALLRIFFVFKRRIAGCLTKESGEKVERKHENDRIIFFIGKVRQTRMVY